MGRMGGFCDCEIFLNGVQLHPASRVRVDDEAEPARSRRPVCAGVRKGSTQGCAHWVRQRRDRCGAYDDDF